MLVGAVVLVVRNDQIHNTESKGYDIKCAQSGEPSATMNTLICTAEHSQKAENGKPDPAWWHVFFTWPEGITALLLLFTLGVITWQAWETRKAAEASLESARAALISAHAGVNAQRAQLLFVVKKEKGSRPGQAIFDIWVKNFGKTPARLVGWRPQNELFVADAKSLPTPPVYTGLYALESYLIPDGEILVASFNPSEPGQATQRAAVSKADNVGFHDVQALVYGQVEYLDGISHDRQTSRYCFRFQREPFSNIGGSIEPCGPPEYNYCS
jgi:hypothetical protein